MTSSLKRSPSGMRLAKRISTWKKPGMVKRLRPRVPSQPAGGVTPGTRFVNGFPLLFRHKLAGPKVTPRMNGSEVAPPTDGRSCAAPSSKRVSESEMMLKGRPEATSMMGESVKSDRKCLKYPSPDLALPD